MITVTGTTTWHCQDCTNNTDATVTLEIESEKVPESVSCPICENSMECIAENWL